MRIASVHAAATRRRSVYTEAQNNLTGEAEAINPLARYRAFKGAGVKFDEPWPDTVCVVTAEDGTWGVGMTKAAGPVVPVINDYLAPMIVNENAFATERLWNMMVRGCGAYFGATGLSSLAISAVDLALWDLKGKLLGRPVYELLGGPARDAIHCYATSHDLDWCVELGFDAIKVCTLHGAADATQALNLNEQFVAAARDKLGPDLDLMLDCWNVQDATFAIELGSRLAAYDLRWFEDYAFAEDDAGYRRVRERLPSLTLAAGERWYTDRPFHRAAQDSWVDILQPDVQWVGGATASLKIATIAEAAGLEIAMHCGCNDAYGQHLCHALPGNRWGEFYIATPPGADLLNGFRATPGMALPVGGKLVPSDAPGFGIELTLDMIESSL